MNSRNVDGLEWVERAEQALRQVPLFSGLDGVVCRKIVSQGRLQCVSRGTVVVTEGDVDLVCSLCVDQHSLRNEDQIAVT